MTTTAPGSAVASLQAQLFGAPPAQPPALAAAGLITAMLDSGAGISDLVFSPGRPPLVERHGELTPVAVPAYPIMKSGDTAAVARELIGATLLLASDTAGSFITGEELMVDGGFHAMAF